MSIQIKNLTKYYGTQKAVDNLSFSVDTKEVVGFLGPNGAGKTTTMKIISCFIPQSEGEVAVCGFDVTENPMEVRQQIGYLPEHNPLYLDMYVREYLAFAAQSHELDKTTTKASINKMIELTGLEREQNKQIGQLSKGYRQRVGLAQAMIHNPKVLILDEPTSGLDPNQLADIRQLIQNLGKEKTVILSTHIMQEVQALCERVLIINKGKMVANNTVESLKQSAISQAIITVEFSQSLDKQALMNIKHIEKVEKLNHNKFQILSDGKRDIRADIFNFAVEKQLTLLTLQQENNSLEQVFQELTRE